MERAASFCVRRPARAIGIGVSAASAAIILLLLAITFLIAADRATLRADALARDAKIAANGAVENLTTLAEMHARRGDLDTAIAKLREAEDLLPSTPLQHRESVLAIAIVRTNIVQTLMAAGRYPEASTVTSEIADLLSTFGDEYSWRPSGGGPKVAEVHALNDSCQLMLPSESRHRTAIEIGKSIDGYLAEVPSSDEQASLLRLLSDALTDSGETALAKNARDRADKISPVTDPVSHLLELCARVRLRCRTGCPTTPL